LDGRTVPQINADLTTGGMNLSDVRPLNRNQGISFEGIRKDGPLDIQGTLAREWLNLPSNPNGRMNSDVLKPLMNAMDITRRPRDIWIIDFGTEMSAADAALFETPFEYVVEHVKPLRDKNRDKIRRTFWWRTGRSGADLRAALEPLSRYIVTPRVAKHRVFIWLDKSIIPDTRLNSIACEDDATFGVLHSRIHEVWSLATCSWHGVGNDPTYNAKSCFETFPLPPGFSFVSSCLCGDSWNAIAKAAKRLDELRTNWLNPPEWIECIPEVVPGYPDRIIAKPGHEADLKKRTLTNLYNARPAWLDNIHKELDAAVATSYGWDDYTPDMPDEEILARLFALNQDRVSKVNE